MPPRDVYATEEVGRHHAIGVLADTILDLNLFFTCSGQRPLVKPPLSVLVFLEMDNSRSSRV